MTRPVLSTHGTQTSTGALLRGCVKPIVVYALLVVFARDLRAERTPIEVRAIAKGAKFIGTSMGGVRIRIEDAVSGDLLAEGTVAGSTGDTAKLMTEPLARPVPRATKGAAVYRTNLELRAPRQVRITARGPLGQPQAVTEVSTTVWVAPGMPVTGGDGVVLELPGFVVDVVSPLAHASVEVGSTVTVRANVVMMCGCPIEPGGLWDASKMKFVAYVYRDGKEITRVPGTYAGQTNQFRAEVLVRKPGDYMITFVAHDPRDGNTGVDSVAFSAR